MRCCSPVGIRSLFVHLILLSVTATASEPRRLTVDGRQKSSPLFVNEGREVVYVDFADSTLYQLRRLELSTGKIERLHPDATAAEFEPARSRDSQTYAHLKLRGTLSIGIVVRDQLGGIINEILPGPGFRGYRSPALAPDHSRLAFSYAEGGTQQIYSSKLDGTDRKLVTNFPGIANWPDYSPNGQSIVFGSSRDGNFEIYRVTTEGADLQRLTNNPFQDLRPRFSPDGSRIVFTSHRDGNAEIYVMNADGSHQQRVTTSDEREDYPEWHPDGNQLVIVREVEGQSELFLLELPH